MDTNVANPNEIINNNQNVPGEVATEIMNDALNSPPNNQNAPGETPNKSVTMNNLQPMMEMLQKINSQTSQGGKDKVNNVVSKMEEQSIRQELRAFLKEELIEVKSKFDKQLDEQRQETTKKLEELKKEMSDMINEGLGLAEKAAELKEKEQEEAEANAEQNPVSMAGNMINGIKNVGSAVTNLTSGVANFTSNLNSTLMGTSKEEPKEETPNTENVTNPNTGNVNNPNTGNVNNPNTGNANQLNNNVNVPPDLVTEASKANNGAGLLTDLGIATKYQNNSVPQEAQNNLGVNALTPNGNAPPNNGGNVSKLNLASMSNENINKLTNEQVQQLMNSQGGESNPPPPNNGINVSKLNLASMSNENINKLTNEQVQQLMNSQGGESNPPPPTNTQSGGGSKLKPGRGKYQRDNKHRHSTKKQSNKVLFDKPIENMHPKKKTGRPKKKSIQQQGAGHQSRKVSRNLFDMFFS